MTTGTDSTARLAESPSQTAPCWTFLPLHGVHGEGKFTMLDSGDAVVLNGRRMWFNPHSGYVIVQRGDQPDNLHRELFGLERGDSTQVDHINRKKLDNRRCNLRLVTANGNHENAGHPRGESGYRGVSRNNQKQPGWMARVTVEGECHCLGTFPTPEEAAQVARDFRAKHTCSID
jgi:hypothetical protein